ncbi:uncharacterized protein LOC109706728 [Ananas comosus]|uniref:Uncharacterized protein LOC109706728 n=1 Tax=Ananas comosus TaxID=4615 RepID=A0A6P5EPV7_ANACO|nr:uncharacterized protein LOC109706728 [Ananas comosus]
MAADPRDAHVVEIPSDAPPQSPALPSIVAASAAIQHHPLTQISESPGHLLLLKLWQREEDLHGRRAAALESRMDAAKRGAFELSSLFFAFHGLSLTLLFASSAHLPHRACRHTWWVPAALSLSTSLVLACAVHARVSGYWDASRRLTRERGEGRALARCMQELRMKGASFDLSKQPHAAASTKRMKSSSVEVTWRPIAWVSRNLVTIALLCVAGVVVPCCKFILCG